MKKYVILALMVIYSTVRVNAQEGEAQIYLGANGGITTTNNTQFVVGLDGELLIPVESNFKVGAATGLIFATDNNGIVLPLALAGRLKADSKFGLGLDFGYGIPINRSRGSLYFRPMLDYQLSGKSKLRFSYSGLNNIGYLNVGIIFRVMPRRSITVSW